MWCDDSHSLRRFLDIEDLVDRSTEAILAAEVYHADQADSATLIPSLERAQENLEWADVMLDIQKVVADKGYHKAQTLAECGVLDGGLGIKRAFRSRSRNRNACVPTSRRSSTLRSTTTDDEPSASTGNA